MEQACAETTCLQHLADKIAYRARDTEEKAEQIRVQRNAEEQERMQGQTT